MNKAQLKRLAVEVRAELDLTAHDLFDPHDLASLYGVEVLRLSDLGCSFAVLNHFQVHRPEVFSGALVPLSDGSTVIIENDCHPRERRVSTASHELSHVVLEHPFSATLSDANGCRVSTPQYEQEAAELSGELLLPFEACKRLAFFNTSDEAAASKFGVSVEFARWRLNSTGARKIAARGRLRTGDRSGARRAPPRRKRLMASPTDEGSSVPATGRSSADPEGTDGPTGGGRTRHRAAHNAAE